MEIYKLRADRNNTNVTKWYMSTVRHKERHLHVGVVWVSMVQIETTRDPRVDIRLRTSRASAEQSTAQHSTVHRTSIRTARSQCPKDLGFYSPSARWHARVYTKATFHQQSAIQMK